MTDQKLITSSIKGNRKAQKALYEQYRGKWFSICLRYSRNRDDALDILQNALVNIFTKMKQFDSSAGTFQSWSCKIVSNQCISFYRKKIKNSGFTDLDEARNIYHIGETPIDKLTVQEMTQHIQTLPEGCRLIFNMYVVEGYKHKEIADELGISIGTSKSQLFQAKTLLKKKFKLYSQFEISHG